MRLGRRPLIRDQWSCLVLACLVGADPTHLLHVRSMSALSASVCILCIQFWTVFALFGAVLPYSTLLFLRSHFPHGVPAMGQARLNRLNYSLSYHYRRGKGQDSTPTCAKHHAGAYLAQYRAPTSTDQNSVPLSTQRQWSTQSLFVEDDLFCDTSLSLGLLAFSSLAPPLAFFFALL